MPEKLIGWINKSGTHVIRHSNLSAKGHRPFFPASLDPKNTRAFRMLRSIKDQTGRETVVGLPVYFSIQKQGVEEIAVDVEILSSGQRQELKVDKVAY